MPRLALFALITLAACATPREQCERAATEDLNVISALIVETEQNIARGYAIRRREEVVPSVQFCFADELDDNFGISFCNDLDTRVVETPVPIDLAAERRKLADLKRKRAELTGRTAEALAACAAAYPES